ncbi:MAG: hypothetical protein M0Z49_01010 [Chloroflexi bacterium]|nr:hypothetical protein [Chloroflexota bacterium]
MGAMMNAGGYYSLLRWQSDPARGEARNVAVLLVDADGEVAGIRAAPVSAISPRLHEQGLLDGILVSLDRRLAGSERPTVGDLREMSSTLTRSISLSEPRPVAVGDFDTTLSTLYRALVSRPGRSSKVLTKGLLLDRVVRAMRHAGQSVLRSQYVGDFLIDVVIDAPNPTLGEVLSFASGAQNTVPIENDAGHFLYALERLQRGGLAVVEPPPADAALTVREAHARVLRWFGHAGVPVQRIEELTPNKPLQQALDIAGV